jgi:hypothetical protein
MKIKIRPLVLLACLFLSTQLTAQKRQFTGKVTYEIEMNLGGVPAEAAGMLPSSMTLLISAGKVKTEVHTMMGVQSSIMDLNEKSIITLMEVMGQKLAILDTWENLAKDKKVQPVFIISETGKTKMIAGYPAKKVLIKSLSDTGEETLHGMAWYTEALNIHPDFNFSKPMHSEINGLLLEYEMDAGNNIKMKLTATEITSERIRPATFAIPDDYEIITRAELSKRIDW